MTRVLLDARDAVDTAKTADPDAASLDPDTPAEIEARSKQAANEL